MRPLLLSCLLCVACSEKGQSTVPSQQAGTGSIAGTAASSAGTGASGRGAAGATVSSAAGTGGVANSGGLGGAKAAGAGGASPTNDPAASDDAGALPGADPTGAAPSGACTREVLAAAVDSYYAALSAHDPKKVNASPSIKVTEDGKTITLGEGLMKTAGMVKFKRSALDTLQCETVTESVVENGGDDYVVGTRLKVAAGQVSEVEAILVGPDGWFPNPDAVVSSKTDDWEKPLLAEADRSPRDKLKKDIVDAYFLGVFGGKIPVSDYPFASDCKRAENGFSPGACDFGVPTSMPMTPLHYVVDVEAGIAVGFVLFGGSGRGLDDFHMFRVKAGEVHAVRAVVGPTVSNRGWPTDPPGTP